MTMRGGEAGIKKEWNNELTSKRAPIDLNPPSKTHKLAIDLRSPITANSPPNPPYHLQTATHKMSTENSRFTYAVGPSGCTPSSSAGPSSQAGSSTSAGCSANALPNDAHDQRQFINSLALAFVKEKKHMSLPGTMGAPVLRGGDVNKFIDAYESLSSCTGTTRCLTMLSQQSRTTCRKRSTLLSRWWMDIRWRTGCSYKRSSRTPSDSPIAKSICTPDRTSSNNVGNSWNVRTSAWKTFSSPKTTSAALWSTRDPWSSTPRWKWCLEPSQEIWKQTW